MGNEYSLRLTGELENKVKIKPTRSMFNNNLEYFYAKEEYKKSKNELDRRKKKNLN